jgi:predicted metalloprotease
MRRDLQSVAQICYRGKQELERTQAPQLEAVMTSNVMKRNLTFRKAIVADTSTVVQIGTETFQAAFGPYHAPEDMEQYLTANFNKEIIQSLIEDVTYHFLLGYGSELMRACM